MTDYGAPELDFCDSASASSSALVITPLSGQDLLKRPDSIVPQIQNDTPFKLSTPQLQPYRRPNMFKGPIQPHVSNLPRRKPRRKAAKGVASKSLSSASIRTNAAASPSIPPSSVRSSSSSSRSRSPRPYFINNDSPSVAGFIAKPVTATSPSLELSRAHPLSKGHLQPHVTNMPRRRPKHPRTPIRSSISLDQRRQQEKEAWVEARCLQEVGKGSGVWVAFWDWENQNDSDDNGDGEQPRLDISFADELLCAERVIRVGLRAQEEIPESEIEENLLSILLLPQLVQGHDDGTPHLSDEQLFSARDFLSQLPKSISEHANSTTALPSSLSSCPDASSPSKRVLISIPNQEYTADAIALVVLTLSLLDFLPAAADFSMPSFGSPALNMLVRLHDEEDLGLPWRGAMSCDGIEWLDDIIGNDESEANAEEVRP
ncbi:hypothetical protein BDP27DRAFT_1315176 [Rhodocollybia butyracea]|uniref:Uncharacterized protein n=1 Tax=Rhodocollybia butyracea TaxID=206335 RepID=A0A9P5UEP9_9AGAR|nr:hypothetical protein BDP27DRAFT_1315176 [Rhodocollybia butyracea]